MVFQASNYHGNNNAAQIKVATSTDLYHWTRHPKSVRGELVWLVFLLAVVYWLVIAVVMCCVVVVAVVCMLCAAVL